MKTEDLTDYLNSKGVNPYDYSIGVRRDGTHVIINENRYWRVFVFERGEESLVSVFTSEEAACAQFVKDVLKYCLP